MGREAKWAGARGMWDFNGFVDGVTLIEVPLVGRSFTWANSCSATKIDRCFVLLEWLLAFLDCKLWGQLRAFQIIAR